MRNIAFTQKHVGRAEINGIGDLRNFACCVCFFSPFSRLSFCGFGELVLKHGSVVVQRLAISRHTTLVIAIRTVHIFTADRRDDSHISWVHAGMGTASLGDGVQRR